MSYHHNLNDLGLSGQEVQTYDYRLNSIAQASCPSSLGEHKQEVYDLLAKKPGIVWDQRSLGQ